MSFIKLDRKMLSWGWFTDPDTTHLWVYILLSANFKENVWKGETFEEGSFPASIEKISAETGLSIQNVRTGLKRLEKTGEITRKSTNHGTKIIVNKWAEYQGFDDEPNTPSNKQLTSNQQATNKQLTTLKESKKVIREEYTSKEEINKEEKAKKIDLSGYSDRFVETYNEFMEMRKRKKNPNTLRSQELILKQLFKISNDEDVQIQSMEQSIRNGWLDVYPPKENARPKQQATGLEALMQI